MLQSLALSILKSWRNVFLTGQAGSGKTYVINQYIQWLWSCGVEVAITASTGIAATHIGGVTIHSRSGIGIKDHLTDHDMELLQQKERLHKNIIKAKVLIIDEISMLSANTIDMVDRVVQMIRRDGRPFGGLQVIFVGDFFQLPPVMSSDSGDSTKRFAFASKAWKDLDLVMCYLHTQHRQSEGDFPTILNQLRKWAMQAESLTILKTRYNTPLSHKNPVKLYTHNIDVDRINNEKLDALLGETESYLSTGVGEPALVAALTKSMLAPELLDLKIGAQVIFVKNNPAKWYYNGTIGEVVGFDDLTKYPLVKIASDYVIKVEPEIRSVENMTEIVASVRQIPLKLARAITVHKSQGMTLDAAEMDLSKVFEPGQAYVALSRIRSLDGLNLLGINEQWLNAHPLVLRADGYFREQSELVVEKYGVFDKDTFQEIHKYFIWLTGGSYVEEVVTIEKTVVSGKKQKTKSSKPKAEKGDSVKQTLELIKADLDMEDICAMRGLAESTIWSHIFQIHALHPWLSLKQFKPWADILSAVKKAVKVLSRQKENCDEYGKVRLKAIFDFLEQEYSYEEIKRCMIFIS